ncbi:hypothetical protein [Acinetobacter silvestris]|uniref:DUF3298 domain-containing protein n=1 Tax=Acinetobacter silvestris TaxID=1977882 RepID=A0A1Y3CFN8_9GAMM|nr:hypothetical protein [Acinetobacter silvestris]OTG64731.1 hypothetical protein B9T28_11030 [Acinetobacter silvestris]
MQNQKIIMLILCLSSLSLVACDSKKEDQTATSEPSVVEAKADILPYLHLQSAQAEYALPFCEKKNCIEIDIQTLKTQDPWMNQWIATNQSIVIQRQIDLKQNMTLQQAIDAYVKKSDAWQDDFSKNKAYELHMQTRMASQRNQYVLLQVSVHSLQAEVSVKERQYFFVGDRKLKKTLSLLDVIQVNQQNQLNTWVQEKYQAWLETQTQDIQSAAPKKIFWGQSDWFFDGEGIGLHYRASEIVKDGAQLDIYLTKQQTQQILKPEIFQQMF